VTLQDEVNAMDPTAFFATVGKSIGAEALQALLGRRRAGQAADEEAAAGVVVSDAHGANAIADVLTAQAASGRVDDALDFVAEKCPHIDIALVGSLFGFWRYTPGREYALGMTLLRELVEAKLVDVSKRPSVDGAAGPVVAVIDASYAETNERFLEPFRNRAAVVLVPFVTLVELDATLTRHTDVPPDERSRAVAAMSSVCTAAMEKSGGICCEILHFSECLPAVPRTHGSDVNGTIVAIARMLQAALPQQQVLICTDDDELAERVDSEECGLGVLRSKAARDDAPFDIASALPSGPSFTARLETPARIEAAPTTPPSVRREEAEPASAAASWLDMLDDDDASPRAAEEFLQLPRTAAAPDVSQPFKSKYWAAASVASKELLEESAEDRIRREFGTPEAAPSAASQGRPADQMQPFRGASKSWRERTSAERVRLNVNDPRGTKWLRRHGSVLSRAMKPNRNPPTS
jgi:hypothetical protein